MTAKAALDAVKDAACVRRVYYIDYASSQLRRTSRPKTDMESSVLAVTLAGVQALDTARHAHYDGSFVGRNYFRVQEPTGRCDSRHTAFARHRSRRASESESSRSATSRWVIAAPLFLVTSDDRARLSAGICSQPIPFDPFLSGHRLPQQPIGGPMRYADGPIALQTRRVLSVDAVRDSASSGSSVPTAR